MKRKLNEHDVPEAVAPTFAGLGIDNRILPQFIAPTAIQSQAIPAILNGKHVIGSLLPMLYYEESTDCR